MSADPFVVAHYRAALDHIQRAQNELAAAARLLSPINRAGAVDWRKINGMYGRVRKLWYAIENRIPKLRRERLDGVHGTTHRCDACKSVELAS